MKLIDALWASRLTPKDNIGLSPYTLVYGKEENMPGHLELNVLTYDVNIEDVEKDFPLQRRYDQLLLLKEKQREALKKMSQRKHTIKIHFDQSATTKGFQKGQLALLWNKAKEKPSLHTNFEVLWIDPYMIEKVLGYNSYQLKYMKGTIHMLLVNEQHLKKKFS